MKFYDIVSLTEMARLSKSALFGKVKINPEAKATPQNVTNIKMYLLDQFDDTTKAAIFNSIISDLKDTKFESYEDLYNFVQSRVSDAIKVHNGKQNTTKLKWTTRVVFNTLVKIKALESGGSAETELVPSEQESTPASETPEESAAEDVEAPVKGVYVLNNANFLEKGLDKLYGFPPSIVEPLTTFFEEHDGKTMPDMKIRLSIQKAVSEYIEGRLDEEEQDRVLKILKKDNMAELMIKLKGAQALQSPEKAKEKSEEEKSVPLLDVGEEEPSDVSDRDIERLTGGYGPERDFDTSGIDFG